MALAQGRKAVKYPAEMALAQTREAVKPPTEDAIITHGRRGVKCFVRKEERRKMGSDAVERETLAAPPLHTRRRPAHVRTYWHSHLRDNTQIGSSSLSVPSFGVLVCSENVPVKHSIYIQLVPRLSGPLTPYIPSLGASEPSRVVPRGTYRGTPLQNARSFLLSSKLGVSGSPGVPRDDTQI